MVKDELPTNTATLTALNWPQRKIYLRLLQLECVLPTDETSTTNNNSYYISELPRLE